MKYVVTGGAGYLGAHLVSRLVKAGHSVVVLDDFSHGSATRLPEGVDLIVGSVSDPQALDSLSLHGTFDGLFHLAARKSISESINNPELYFEVNTRGTENMLSACANIGIKNVIFTSSAAVYGSINKSGAITETDETHAINAYGQSKLMAEEALRVFSEEDGNSGVALRCFNLAGAESADFFDFEGENVIPIILRRLNDGEVFHQYGRGLGTPDGSCVRDYIHVGDVADAHIQAMKALESRKLSGFEILNVSSGVGTSLDAMLEKLQRESSISLNIEKEDLREGEASSVVGDNSKIRNLLGWIPAASIDQIVRESWSANVGKLSSESPS